MDLLSRAQLQKMDTWMRGNARPYDLAKWEFVFFDKPKENIVSEMLKFQNDDGGFGNGFEADIFLPSSSAIVSAEAIFQAYEYQLDCDQPWFHNLLSYFEGSVQDIAKFWEDIPKTAMDYPHAPWWNYAPSSAFSPNPCAVIASALIRFGTDRQRQLGESVAKRCLDFLTGDAFCGDHHSYNLIKLVEELHGVSSPLITEEVIAAMRRRIAENVCYNSDKWMEYRAQPLDFVDGPDSMWYDDVKDGIEDNLAFWLNHIGEDGVWAPNFSWGVDSESSRQATQIWTGYIAVKRAKILLKFGRIEGMP